MDDEELFHRRMDSLGVKPIARRETPRGRPERRPAGDDAAGTAPGAPDDEDDESLFFETMGELDVVPLPGGRPEGKKKRQEAEPPPRQEAGPDPRRAAPEVDDELEDSVFLDTMDGLVVVPDKDDRYRLPETPRPRKVRPPKPQGLSIDEQVDLHGQTVEEALIQMRRFIGLAVTGRSRTVLVVTGKGHHSESGKSVLRRAVERWLRRDAASWVREYSDAPRTLGGGGAFVVWLR